MEDGNKENEEPKLTNDPIPNPVAIPTATPTTIATATPTPTAIATPPTIATATSTPTAIATPTTIATATPTATPTAIATPTTIATATPTAAPTATPTAITTATTISTVTISEDSKEFSPEQTVAQIISAQAGQTTTTARVELTTCNESLAAAGSKSKISVGICEQLVANAGAMCASAGRGSGATGRSATVSSTGGGEGAGLTDAELDTSPTGSIRSIGSFVCRICHNSENPERLVSPCLCKGSLSYVHIHCLERWISTSRSTTCELCQFQYNTEQTLRYTCIQSLRMWYSRSMSRRALQEDCQMFSLLTLVAFGIVGTLLVGIQYYFMQDNSWGLNRIWTKGWLVFFLFTTLIVYFINIYMIVRSQLSPWYRWWQSARDIKLILENRRPFSFRPSRRLRSHEINEQLSAMSMYPQHSSQPENEAQPPPQLEHSYQEQPFAAAPSPQAQQLQTAPHSYLALPATVAAAATSVQLQDLSAVEAGCKRPLVATAVLNVATADASIEIPLQGYVYEFGTVM